MPAPLLLPARGGEQVVCVQWVPAGFSWRGQFGGPALVRINVVDLQQMAVVATRELSPAAMRFAVGLDALYIADNDAKRLRILSMADLSDVREVALDEAVEGLLIAGDSLLCSTDGRLRLDLPELNQSEKWQPIGRPDPVFRVEGGWHVDGVIYDEALSRARLLATSPMNLNKDFAWYRLWGADVKPLTVGAESSTNYVVSSDYPIAVHVLTPQELPADTDVPIRLAVEEFGTGIVAEISAGVASQELVNAQSGRRVWNFSRMVNPSANPLKPDPLGAGHSLFPCATAGRAILLVIDGRLIVWRLEDALLDGLAGPLRFQLEQSSLVAGFDGSTRLSHTTIGGTPPVQFHISSERRNSDSPDVEIAPKSMVEQYGVDRFLANYRNSYHVATKEDFDALPQRYAPFAERVLGRPVQGLLYTHRVNLRASDSGTPAPATAELGYYVIYEVPEELYRPNFEAHWQRSGRAVEARRKETEQQQAKAAATRAAEREREEREAVQGAISQAFGPVVPLLLSLTGAAPIWIGLLATRQRPRMRGKYLGVLVALLGLAPLLLVLLVGVILVEGMGVLELSPSSQNMLEAVVFPATLMFLGMMLVTGTMLVAIRKGYSPWLGFVVGLVAPLGLLVMILMPERATRSDGA